MGKSITLSDRIHSGKTQGGKLEIPLMNLDRTIQAVQLLAVLAIALLSCQTLPAGDRTASKSELRPIHGHCPLCSKNGHPDCCGDGA